MDALVADIEQQILQQYVDPSYVPLVSLACRRWYDALTMMNGGPHITYDCGCAATGPPVKKMIPPGSIVISLADIARDGNAPLLNWIRLSRCKRWQFPCTYDHCMSAAARCGHAHIVRLCLDGGWFADTDVYNVHVAVQAARGGHVDILYLLHSKWSPVNSPHSLIMGAAARGGHLHLLDLYDQLLSDQNTGSFAHIVGQAARGGHEQLVQWLIFRRFGQVGPLPTAQVVADIVMIRAASGGHASIVRFAHDILGATNVGLAIRGAAQRGYEHIVRLCHDEYSVTNTDIDAVMVEAAGNGHTDIVRLCHDVWGATNVRDAMRAAAARGHNDIVRLCHDDWGATLTDVLIAMKAVVGAMTEQLPWSRSPWHHGHIDVIRQCSFWVDNAFPR